MSELAKEVSNIAPLETQRTVSGDLTAKHLAAMEEALDYFHHLSTPEPIQEFDPSEWQRQYSWTVVQFTPDRSLRFRHSPPSDTRRTEYPDIFYKLRRRRDDFAEIHLEEVVTFRRTVEREQGHFPLRPFSDSSDPSANHLITHAPFNEIVEDTRIGAAPLTHWRHKGELFDRQEWLLGWKASANGEPCDDSQTASWVTGYDDCPCPGNGQKHLRSTSD